MASPCGIRLLLVVVEIFCCLLVEIFCCLLVEIFCCLLVEILWRFLAEILWRGDSPCGNIFREKTLEVHLFNQELDTRRLRRRKELVTGIYGHCPLSLTFTTDNYGVVGPPPFSYCLLFDFGFGFL